MNMRCVFIYFFSQLVIDQNFYLLGRLARDPVALIAAASCSGLVFDGSYSTVAVLVAALTITDLTPSIRRSACRTGISQATQLSPSTEMTVRLIPFASWFSAAGGSLPNT